MFVLDKKSGERYLCILSGILTETLLQIQQVETNYGDKPLIIVELGEVHLHLRTASAK